MRSRKLVFRAICVCIKFADEKSLLRVEKIDVIPTVLNSEEAIRELFVGLLRTLGLDFPRVSRHPHSDCTELASWQKNGSHALFGFYLIKAAFVLARSIFLIAVLGL